MLAAPLIALAAVFSVALALVALVVSGWLPRLAAQGTHIVASLAGARGNRSRLSSRERAELRARLWIPW